MAKYNSKNQGWIKWAYWIGGIIAAGALITLVKVKDSKTFWDMMLEKFDKE